MREEVELALTRRVRVVVVDLPDSRRFPLLRDLDGLRWDEGEPKRLHRVEQRILDALVQRRQFDQRVGQMVQAWCGLHGWQPREIDRRRWRLFHPSAPRRAWLLEYEEASHSLDRLYRLFQSYQDICAEQAVFIHGGAPLSRLEQEAVRWAVHGEPLHVAALEELLGLLGSPTAETLL